MGNHTTGHRSKEIVKLDPKPIIKEIPEKIIEVEEVIEYVETVVEADPPADPDVIISPHSPAHRPTPPPVPDIPEIITQEKEPAFLLRPAVMPRMCSSCDVEDLDQEEKNKCASLELLKLVQSRVSYPPMAREIGIQGTCAIQFRINADGRISHIKLLKDIGAGCGQAALKALESLDDQCWHPGLQNGKPVAVQMTLPVRFKLE